MIEIYDWRKSSGVDVNLSGSKKVYDIAFACSQKYDDRSDWSSRYLETISVEVIHVEYSHEDFTLKVGETIFELRNSSELNYSDKKILIDATSLPFPEIIHLFRVMDENNHDFDVIYVQPDSYREEKANTNIENVRSFSLSDDILAAQQLPPFVNYSFNTTLFVCLGFEGHRFGALVHSEEIDTRNLTCLVGVPAFKAGWENKSLSNNYKIMMDLRTNSDVSYKHAPANDPLGVYEEIKKAYTSSKYQKRGFCMAPIGTKPSAIAVAQFAVNKSDVVVLYDFVQKKQKRSIGTDTVHVWRYRSGS